MGLASMPFSEIVPRKWHPKSGYRQFHLVAHVQMRYFSFGYGYLGVDLCHIGEFQHRLSGEHVGSQVHVLGSDDA